MADTATNSTEKKDDKTAGNNPRVYFDITIGQKNAGRIVMELYAVSAGDLIFLLIRIFWDLSEISRVVYFHILLPFG